MYIVESDFIYHEHRCVVIFNSQGFRDGYVGVDENSPLFGMDYTDYLDINRSEIDCEPMGKRGIFSLISAAFDDDDRVRLDTYFNVHGSITFSDGNLLYPVKSPLWWFGFDCGHARDGIDYELVKKYWGFDYKIMKSMEMMEDLEYQSEYPVRSIEYCEEECKSLVDQIIELEFKLKRGLRV